MKKFSSLLLALFFVFTVTHTYSAQVVTETELIDADGLEALLPGGESARPLLINFWATWCGPCRAEFPELVGIDQEFREKGLDFVIVSVDRPTMIEFRVAEFLRQYESTMSSYLINLWDRNEITTAIRRIAPRYNGGYPFTVLFNSKGKLVYQKQGIVDPAVLRKEIRRVLPKEK